ncbi:hypothetical protein [Sphingomonas mucosissima]|uniref:Uncharacterized protein n=1 Tax=Sphingomonas mucosissima TaxID=370959 RepID=A0A245ZEQ5_9SPHN|nr:hypothetical protein [Sphingomonas mucosissima]OWK28218.1 hypothetical protein SPMU_30740 [Sphingomonas mucosissima]
MRTFVSALTLSIALVACSPDPDPDPDTPNAAQAPEVVQSVPEPDASAMPEQSRSPAASTPSPTPTTAPSPGKVLALEGLGDLRIGAALPRGGSWAERGAQIDGDCRTVSSPSYPGVYAIVTDGKVRRITIGERSDVKLVEGIGVGASERDVVRAFGGFRAEPHEYVAAPAKYLTAPNAAGGDPALRFEIGQDRKVSLIHVGTMPALGYVEGCA